VCEHCSGPIRFTSHRCPTCGAELGYDTDTRRVRVLVPANRPSTFAIDGSPTLRWRCLNAAWGCNWTLPAGTDAVWCRACALTRGRPDEQRGVALRAWVVAEAAKRRLVHQLDHLGLPIVPRSPDAPDGLAFDFVAVPELGGITGFRAGVVTLDLAEVDDTYRDEQRRAFGERSRSVVGHLRHEIGHHYWELLVRGAGAEDAFRVLFGDERADYRNALDTHYTDVSSTWDTTRYVSRYATSHPHEDWAETFAACLRILDVLATAVAHGLLADHDGRVAGDAATLDIDLVLTRWRAMGVALDDLVDAVGGPPSSTPDAADVVVDKLSFVHDLVRRAAIAGYRSGPPQMGLL
jgi:hypothetical protein